MLRVHAPHAIYHLFANLYRRWIQFWIMPKDVAKINVKEMTCSSSAHQPTLTDNSLTIWRNEQIVKMAIPNTQYIGNDTIAS